MSYSDRVSFFTYEIVEDELGAPIKTPVKKTVPCRRGRLTHDQQIGIFGKYNLDAFTLHLQGKYKELEEVEYRGITRKVQAVIEHRHSTVLVI